MAETRAPYVTSITKADTTITDGDTSAALRLFEAAGVDGKRLLAMAHRCLKVARRGHGKVIMTWNEGKPELLIDECSDLWR
jgi:hypothetical protein